MDQIEYPSKGNWQHRREWFEALFNVDLRGGGYMVGEHASGLLIDLQSTFCAGAFAATIIVAAAVIDANLRDVELDKDFQGGMKSAFEFSGNSSELEWLRTRRNSLVHFKDRGPLAISVDEQWENRHRLELEARRAINTVADTLFENPWV